MKKIISLSLVIMLLFAFAVGCTSDNGGNETPDTGNQTPPANDTVDFDTSETINVVSREDGSGTRGAFVEIVGVEDADGNDATYEEAVIQNGTSGVMTTVAGDKYSIGYISLGSLNDTVKSVSVEGAEATTENIKSGAYKIARPFNIAYKAGLSELAQDFVNFIMSADGQAIIADNSLIEAADDAQAYTASGLSGTITVGGSTSVTPVMEKLAEAYEGLNEGVSIEIQSTGSSAGMTAAIEGSADIGMASRDLKDSEKAELEYQAIGIDGIAVIVNNESTITDLSIDEIKSIYLGETTTWSEVE
ncbi:MAG: substrate-binding domain-containing protein [Tissierellaceae bacterium]|nr:substrate-binding domain-containing protein [Tissierellaceae bacterium]